MENSSFDKADGTGRPKKYNIEKRKKKFNQKLLSGDLDAMRKFMGICSPLDEEEANIINGKLDNIIESIVHEFDIETIKSLDCKVIESEIFSFAIINPHVLNVYEIGEYISENSDDPIYIYPCLLELDDGSTIKVLLFEFDEDKDDGDSQEDDDIEYLK